VPASSSRPFRLGLLAWNQYTDWPAFRDIGVRADRLGYDQLWTWDHLYPIVGSPDGPMLEAYALLAGWAGVTERATLGLMVGANTFRNPALVVKQITTLDHLSGGRAVLGIGGAWFETEHTAFGIDFGTSVGDRLNRLDEAVDLMHGMLRTGEATARGEFYHAQGVRNDPPPVQSHLAIVIGGGGEQKTLRTVARHADMWNVANVDPEAAAHKVEVLRGHCEEIGRDLAEIELSVSLGPVLIRDNDAEAERVIEGIHARNTDMTRPVLHGSPDMLAERIRAYQASGFTNVVYHLPAPYDEETLDRFANEVRALVS
jgi:alkanesulfonate monooxygenase SsuD/methylene tetrahydromethanopterin reductase-like flavin-dependent oxidoreductase (luciferase family)